MTACCCRLTQPETSRSRKASGRGSESMAEACRRGATWFKVRRLFPGGQIRCFGTSPGRVFAQHGFGTVQVSMQDKY